ncbi:hypothetical protein QOZ80_8AG0639140 [Eleusine coracana subsp. coracana]|nr:hypothetical protein QOZ80_8AG0639140 [Eleusine coracana subsp. coracana]
MAAGGGEHRQHSKGRPQRLLFVVEEHRSRNDGHCYSYHVVRINLKDMFTSAVEQDDWAAAMRSFPSPMAEITTTRRRPDRLKLAVAPGTGGTNTIVAVSFGRDTIVYDTAAAAEAPCGPGLRYTMSGGPSLLPLGARLYAIPHFLWPPSGDEQPSFQVLLPPAQRQQRGGSSNNDNGRRWSWRALPGPPPDMYEQLSVRGKEPFCFLTAFLAAGTRVWVSAPDRGTYSFDTARLAWRKEGDWPLPCHGRGIFVPDFGLCFGLCPRRLCLCAFDLPDVASQPPATRYVWQEETYPRECGERGFYPISPGSLAYMGDGKFCITWTLIIESDERGVATRFALFLMAVQVVRCSPPPREAAAGEAGSAGELRVVKHKVRCYKMSPHGINGYVLQPSLA